MKCWRNIILSLMMICVIALPVAAQDIEPAEPANDVAAYKAELKHQQETLAQLKKEQAELLASRDKAQNAENSEELDGLPNSLDEVSQLIDSKMPDTLKKEFAGIKYWQIIAVFVALLLGIILDQIVRLILKMIAIRFIHQRAENHKKKIDKMNRPFGLGASALLWVAMLPIIGLEGLPLDILQGTARVFASLAWIWALWRLIDLVGAVMLEKAEATETKVDDMIVPMLTKCFKLFVLIIGVLYVASALSFDIMPLLASVGIGSLGFAFAAKDTIENFFGSIAVIADRPFEVGDWVVVNGSEGTVEQIGFRSTRIRTFYNSLITLPNADLVRATVDNYGRREYRRTKCHIGVQYDTPVDKLIAMREGIQELIKHHPYTRKDYYQVWFHQFGPSSLDILLYYFVKVPDWTTELRERERLFLDIMRLAEKLGVEFAFPTRTVHLYNHDGNEQKREADMPDAQTDHNAMLNGITAAQAVVSDQPWIDQRPLAHEFVQEPTDVETFRSTQLHKQDPSIGPKPMKDETTGGE